MKFEALKRSIKLNENDACTIYLALCLMDSLYLDIKKESGKNLENNELGNAAKLPIMLARQCRLIRKIYANNIEAMYNYKDSIEKQMNEMADIEKELSQLSDSLEGFDLDKKTLAELNEELAEAQKQKQKHSEIVEQISDAKARLSGFETLDIATEKAELADLEKKCTEFETAYGDVLKQKSKLQNSLDELSEKKSGLENDILDSKREISDTESAIAALEEEMRRLNVSKEEFHSNYAELKEVLPELSKEVELLRPKAEQLVSEKQRLESEKNELKRQRDESFEKSAEIKIEIEDLTSRNEKYKIKIAELAKQRDELETVKNASQRECEQLNSTISSSSEQVRKLKEEIIPKQNTLIEQYKATLLTLNDKITEQKNRIGAMEGHIAEKQKAIDESAEKISRYNETIGSLTKTLEANSTEISELQTTLSELENRSDLEQVEKRKEQLAAAISKLEEAQRLSNDMETQISEKQDMLSAAQKKYEEMLQTKRALENQMNSIKEILREIEYVDKDDYRFKLKRSGERLGSLIKAANDLKSSLAAMHKVVFGGDFDESCSMAANLEQVLLGIDDKIDDIQKNLYQCGKLCSEKFVLED